MSARTLSKVKILVFAAAALAAAGLIAQLAGQGEAPPSRYLPKGALVYLETPNLDVLLKTWKLSDFRAGWEQSRNHEYFLNSRLYLRLQDRTSEFGSAAGFSFSFDNLSKLAGTQSGLALYDIGELKAVAMTRTSLEQAETTELWADRQKFVTRKVGSREYYVEPEDGALAFAYAKPYLVVATEESLLQRTLQAMDGTAKAGETLEQWDKWTQFEAIRKQPQTPSGQTAILQLFLDQENLNRNRYFKHYWIHDNVKELDPIKAAWIELSLGKGAITEHRYFSLEDKQAAPSAAAAAATTGGGGGEAVRSFAGKFSGVRHDFLTYRSGVAADSVAARVIEFFNQLPEQQKEACYPPKFSGSYDRASMAAAKDVYRERVDEPILAPSSVEMLKADQADTIARLLEAARVQAVLRLSYPLWDDKALFVRFIHTMAINVQAPQSIDQARFLETLREHALILAAVHQPDAGQWRKAAASGNYALDWLEPVYARFQDSWILVSNNETELNQLAAALQGAAGPVPSGSYQELNWDNSRWKYQRLMKRLDTDKYQGGDEPLFFSENLDSLFWALSPITASSVENTGSSEVVNYSLKR